MSVIFTQARTKIKGVAGIRLVISMLEKHLSMLYTTYKDYKEG